MRLQDKQQNYVFPWGWLYLQGVWKRGLLWHYKSMLTKMHKHIPWLVWLSGLSASLWNKGLLVRFPVRALAWVAGQVPSRGHMRDNNTLKFLSLSFSLPSSLKINKIKSLKKSRCTRTMDRASLRQRFYYKRYMPGWVVTTRHDLPRERTLREESLCVCLWRRPSDIRKPLWSICQASFLLLKIKP